METFPQDYRPIALLLDVRPTVCPPVRDSTPTLIPLSETYAVDRNATPQLSANLPFLPDEIDTGSFHRHFRSGKINNNHVPSRIPRQKATTLRQLFLSTSILISVLAS